MRIPGEARPFELPHWERIAGQSRFVAYTSQLERELVLDANELAAPPTVALDMGCEGGRFSQILAERGWSMICADIDSQALELCQRRIPEARCVLLTEENRALPCPDGSLGMLLCIECPVLQAEWFAQEATRVLRPGGVLVGVFCNRMSWRGAIWHTLASIRGCEDWYSKAYPSWRRAMRARGFTFVREVGLRWPPFSRTSNSSLLPFALAAERAMGLHKLPAISPLVGLVARKNSATVPG